jgi:hypothetical protein
MVTEPASATRNRTSMAAKPMPGQTMGDPRRFNVRGWLLWTAGFVSFPIAGIAAQAVAGRVNDAAAALIGGLVAGAVIGTGQWLAARRLLAIPRAWIPATAAAMGIGLLAGAAAVGYGTSVGELALMGAITGLPLGAAQAFLLRDRIARPWAWAVAMPLLWAVGWTITASAGIDVDNQYAVFGAFGAITFMALSGALLYRLRAATPAASPPPHRPPTGTAGS